MKKLIVGVLIVACVMMFGCSPQVTNKSSGSSDSLQAASSAASAFGSATAIDLSAYEQDGVVSMVAPIPHTQDAYVWYCEDGDAIDQVHGTGGIDRTVVLKDGATDTPNLALFWADGTRDEWIVHADDRDVILKVNCDFDDIPLNNTGDKHSFLVVNGDDFWLVGYSFSGDSLTGKDASGTVHVTYEFAAINGGTQADLENMLRGHAYISESADERIKSGSPLDFQIRDTSEDEKSVSRSVAYLVDFDCGTDARNTYLIPIVVESNGQMWRL